ncbi:MAG: hypothetical protein MJ113_05025, partial [Lachnospiraceae bacterium]|nr:hypothetical protein [Lachnospiraceae bacterium]
MKNMIFSEKRIYKAVAFVAAALISCAFFLSGCGNENKDALNKDNSQEITNNVTSENVQYTQSTDDTNTSENVVLTYSKVDREDVSISPFYLELEAEDGKIEGSLTIGSSRAGFSGSGYVTNFNQSKGNLWTMNFEVNEEGFYKFTVYTSANEHKINALNVNGVNVGSFTDDSKKFTATVFDGIFLNKGENVVSVTEQWGWFDLDKVVIENSTALSNDYYNGISSELANKNADDKTRRIMEYLVSIYGNHTLTGQYCDNGKNTEIDAIYEATGKYPAVRGFDFIFMSPNSGYKNNSELDRAKEWAKTGGLVSFSWHWHSPVGATEFYTDSTDFKLRKAVSNLELANKSAKEIKTMYENGELREEQYRLIADIDIISFYMKQLQNEGITILWRPLHEASGGWFWWGADGKDNYIWLWQFMFTRQTEYHKLNNLIWVWNGQDNERYPG